MNASPNPVKSLKMDLSEVEVKVLEWAVQYYLEQKGSNAQAAGLSADLRGIAVGFATIRRKQQPSRPKSK
jgi:hypothetical protein